MWELPNSPKKTNVPAQTEMDILGTVASVFGQKEAKDAKKTKVSATEETDISLPKEA